MPSTRDIRRRIRGVRNIKQVTRAMNMIAAARLRRAQAKEEAALSLRRADRRGLAGRAGRAAPDASLTRRWPNAR